MKRLAWDGWWCSKDHCLWLCGLELCPLGKRATGVGPWSCASDSRVWSRIRTKRLVCQPIANRFAHTPSLTCTSCFLAYWRLYLHTHNYFFSISYLIYDFSSAVSFLYLAPNDMEASMYPRFMLFISTGIGSGRISSMLSA